MRDTLTSERGLVQVGRLAKQRLPGALACLVVQPEEMLLSTDTRTTSGSHTSEFDGLAAILASLQEPARNNWSPLWVVSEEDSPVPAYSETFLWKEFSSTWVRRELQEWAERARQLAAKLLGGNVEGPHREADPENEAEWWMAITVKCHGSVESILAAYDKLVERFVAEVPAEARDRIRFEVRIDD